MPCVSAVEPRAVPLRRHLPRGPLRGVAGQRQWGSPRGAVPAAVPEAAPVRPPQVPRTVLRGRGAPLPARVWQAARLWPARVRGALPPGKLPLLLECQ